jgi:hypothetical protein
MNDSDIENKLIEFLDNSREIRKVENLDDDVCDAILCSRFHHYRNEENTEFTYSSLYLPHDVSIDFMIDNATNQVYQIDKVYKIKSMKCCVFKHSVRESWMYIPYYNIQNDCDTCDEETCDKTCDEETCDKTCDGETCDKTCDEETCDKTCDGATQSTICICEEKRLIDIVAFHFDSLMRNDIFDCDDIYEWINT